MKIKGLIYSLLIVSCTLAVTSCAEADRDDTPAAPTEPVRAAFSIKTRAASDIPDNELIQTWWVAFVDQTGTVRAIISRDPSITTAVERDIFGVDIPDGAYTAYAFANITASTLEEKTGITFETGKPAPSDIKTREWNLMPNNISKGEPIPMSGYKEIPSIKSQSGNAIEIEVVRMTAKVEFTFTNLTKKDITVNSITIGRMAKGSVFLLPDYSKLGQKPVLTDGLTTENVAYTLPGDAANRVVKADKGNSLTEFFYVRESNIEGQTPSNRFFVSVNITRDGMQEEQLYGLAQELSFINRNDYIQIPINFNDYVFDIDVLFYPPIGGYPAVLTEERDEEFYVTFGTRGKFSVRPIIRNADTGKVLTPAQFTATVAPADIEDPNGILASATLAYDPVTGEFTGNLTSNTGVAKLKMNVVMADDATARTITKTVYIIRENK